MEFITPIPIDEAERIAWRHNQSNNIFFETQVDIARDISETVSTFTVTRWWKGKGNTRTKTLECHGTFTAASDQRTIVAAAIRLSLWGYALIAIALFLLFAGTTGSRNAIVGVIIGSVLLLQLAVDTYMTYRIINSLKTLASR